MRFTKEIKKITYFILLTSFSLAFSEVSLDTLMTPGEKQKTGYNRLSEKEKANLNIWINAKFNLNAINEDSSIYLSVNVKSGSELILSNDSRWAVAPEDQLISSLWITSFPLKITLGGTKEYPYILTNLYSLKRVKAKPIPS